MMELSEKFDLTASKSFAGVESQPKIKAEQTATQVGLDTSNPIKDRMADQEKVLVKENHNDNSIEKVH